MLKNDVIFEEFNEIKLKNRQKVEKKLFRQTLRLLIIMIIIIKKIKFKNQNYQIK